MLTNPFLERNRRLTDILQIGDYLSRSLRDQVELFSIDENNVVTYITGKGHIIEGTVEGKALKSIEVGSTSIFTNPKEFNGLVEERVGSFLDNLLSDSYVKAEDNFEAILSLWETRTRYDSVTKKFEQKRSKFLESCNIVDTEEFTALKDIKDKLVKVLKEKKDIIFSTKELSSSVKLAKTIFEAFNIQKVDIENLDEYEIDVTLKDQSIYETICYQELVTRELLESKTSFLNSWMYNDKIQKLARTINSSEEDINEALAEAVTEVPYLALSTKGQITEIFSNSLALNEAKITDTKIKNHTATIFKKLKPIRKHVVECLNEMYGVNVQNLKDTPSFVNLAKAQISIFESMAKICNRGTACRKLLKEFASLLKAKGGVEILDVNDFLNEVFEEAEIYEELTEGGLSDYLDFNRVADDLGKIGDVLRMIKGNMAGQEGVVGDENPAEMGEEEYPSDETLDSGDGGMVDDEGGEPQMDPEQAAAEADAELSAEQDPSVAPDEGEMDEEMPEEGEEVEAENVVKDDLVQNLHALEDLIQDLMAEVGGEEEEMPEEDFGDEEVEEEVPEEGEEEVDDSDEEESEEEEFPPKKPKP